MRRLLTVLWLLLMTGCSPWQITAKAPPPPGPDAQEITRAQSINLPKIGSITVHERGSPDDAERAIAARASAAGAAYYSILFVSETVMPGLWYSSAILYGPSGETELESRTGR